MRATVKRKKKPNWTFNWDGKHYSLTTHYGNKYRLSLDGEVKVEALKGNKWVNSWKTNDVVRPTQISFSV